MGARRGRMHLPGIGFDADVVHAGGGERRCEVAGPAADVEQRQAGLRFPGGGFPQVTDHRDGVVGQRTVEAVGRALLEPERRQQPHRPRQRRPVGEAVGGGHPVTLLIVRLG